MAIKRLIIVFVLTLSVWLLLTTLVTGLKVQAAPQERPQAAPPWNASVRVNDNAPVGPVARGAPAFAAKDSPEILYAVWQDERNGDPDIYSAQSADAGQTWTYITRVNHDAPGVGQQNSPDVAVAADGTLHAVWLNSGVYYARSTNGGRTWSDEVKINDSSSWADHPAIAVYTNTLCVAWQDSNFYYVGMDCSADGGLTWRSNDLIAPSVGGATPDLVVDDTGQVHVVWTDTRNDTGDIYYARWSDSRSWSGAVKVNTDAGSATQQNPAIALNNNTLVVGWQDNRSGNQIYARYSASLGATWGTSDAQVSDVGNVVGAPAFTAGRNAIWATWIAFNGSSYFAYADTGASSWGTDVQISRTAQAQQTIATAGSASHVWAGWAQSNAIWAASRTSGAWDDPVQVNNVGEATQKYAALGVGNTGELFAAWNDNRAAGPGLYTAQSADGGLSWGTNNFISGSLDAGQPALAVTDTNNLHAAWRQEDYYYWRIYYNRSGNGGSTWFSPTLLGEYLQEHKLDTSVSPQFESPDVAVQGNTVYVAWAAGGALYLAKSTHGGSTWDTPTNVFTTVNGSNVSASGKVALRSDDTYGENLALAWTNGYNSTCVANSGDGGNTWPEARRICFDTGGATSAQNPAVAFDGYRAIVFWNDNRSGVQHLYRAIWQNGVMIRNSELVDDAAGPASFPTTFTTDEGIVQVAWQDGRNGDDDIYWKRSSNGGIDWQASARVYDDSANWPQQRPVMAYNGNFSPSQIWLAWQDFRRTNWDIYATTVTGTCSVPLTGVGISGPTVVLRGQPVVLTSILTPSNASTPIGYEWRNPPNSIQDTPAATYTWSTYGNQFITLTASNGGGAFSKAHTVQVRCAVPITAIGFSEPLPASVAAGEAFTVTAIMTPASPDLPLNIQWTPEPEAGQGTLQAQFRLTTTGFYVDYVFIKVYATNCGGTWGGSVSYQEEIAVYDNYGPTLSNFHPSDWVNQTLGGYTVPFSVTAQDVGSGLLVTSAVAYYSNDGGATYSSAQPLSVTGSYGTVAPQIVSGQHDFGHESGSFHSNRVRIMITDTTYHLANMLYNIDLDITPPTNPPTMTVRNLNSSIRPTSTWSPSPTLQVSWSGASDGTDGSGLKDYLLAWTQSPSTLPEPDDTDIILVNHPLNFVETQIPSDGQNWYLHLRTRDRAGGLATTAIHKGPYWLDTTPPSVPVEASTTPATGIWTNVTTLTVRWYPATDASSGVAGYGYVWDDDQQGGATLWPRPVFSGGGLVYTTGVPYEPYAIDGNNHWFHVNACDNAGDAYVLSNCSPALNVGPFRIDTHAPSTEAATADRSIGVWSNDNTITLNWQNIDPHTASPKDRYSYVWDTVSNTIPSSTPNLITTTVNISLTTALSDGSNHFFHLRTGDQAGNWSNPHHLGPFRIDTLPPAAPVITYTSPITGEWSSDKTVLVRWSKPPANGGSQVDAYSYLWDHSSSTIPPTTPNRFTTNEVVNTTSDPLNNGNDYYFHVRARDAAGNWGPTTHVGPFMIDATPPLLLADHSSGSAGGDVLLTGLVFPADITVTLSFTRVANYPVELGSFRTSYEGTFQVLATVPADAAVGAHAFVAQGGGKTGRAAFTVTPGMTVTIQPATVSLRPAGTGASVTATLGGALNPNTSIVLQTDWGTLKGPYPLNGATTFNKLISVPRSAISGTHRITATANISGVAVQRAAASFNVKQLTMSIITQPQISLVTTHGQRGDVIAVSGFNDWVQAEEPVENSPEVLLCPPGYEDYPSLEAWIALWGCPQFDGYKLEVDGRTATDELNVTLTGSFWGQTHVPDGWFDARLQGERWPVEYEVPWGATQVCLVGTVHRWHFDTVHDHYGHLYTVQKPSSPEDYDIACAPFTVDPPTPTFSAQYKLISGTQYIPLSKNPKIIVDGRSVGERDATPPIVKTAYTPSAANTPINFTIPEGSYLVSAFACNYFPAPIQFTSGRGNQGLTTIPMMYTPYGGPAVVSLQPTIQTFLYPSQPDRIGPLLSFEGVSNPPQVDLPIMIEFPAPDVASVSEVSATINGIPPVSISNVSGGRIATWNASLLPPGELTLSVQLKGRYLSGQGDCGTTDQWGPVSQKTIVMAAAPPWTHSQHARVTEAPTYDSVAKRYHMAGVLTYTVDIGDGDGTDVGFLGVLKNYLHAGTDVSQDFYVITGTWTAQAKISGSVSLMCLTSIMGDCSKSYTLNLVAEPAGATIHSASDAAFPNRYSSAEASRVYAYNIDPIEVYNGIIASYWGIVNVHLSINFGAGAALDVLPGMEKDLAPDITFIPQANINVPLSLWVDILLGVASAGVDATPSVTLQMPVHVGPNDVQIQGPDVCFRLSGRVWVEALFWDASFGPFDLYHAGSCALQMLMRALETTPPPSTLPAPALATDGYGHVLGAWVHNDSNNPSNNQGILYSVYFDGANWDAQLPVAGSTNLLVSDPAIAFAGEDKAIAVYATNVRNDNVPITWTNVTQQMSSQKISYSIWNGSSWTAPATLATGGGPHGRVTLVGDPYRGRAIAMWIHDATGGSSVKRWLVQYSVFDSETNEWSDPANVDDTPVGSLDAEVNLAFDSTGKATAIWIRQAGVEASSVITSPYTKNDLRTLVTADWYPDEPDSWTVITEAVGLPKGALMPDIAFDDNNRPVIAYALHQKDRDESTATGFGNNTYLGYAIGTKTSGYGPQARAAASWTWTADVVPGVKGVEQPHVAMLPDNQAVVVYRGFGAAGTDDYQGVAMATTIDLQGAGRQQADTATVRVSTSSAIVNGNSWMNDAIVIRPRADGSGALQPRLFTMGAYNLNGSATSVRMSGASLRQVSLAGADPVLVTQLPVVPDLSIAAADVVLSERLPLSGTLVPFTVTVRNLGLARNHQPVLIELIQDPGSLHETLITTGTVPADLIFNGSYDLIGTWRAVEGDHTWLARVTPSLLEDVDGSNNEAIITVGVPAIPEQLVGNADFHSNSAGLSWLPVTGAALSHYHIYRAVGTGNWELLAIAQQTAFTDGTLQPGITYRYAVSAVTVTGVESPLSNELIISGSRALYLPLIRR